jgi:hypothetical protein
MTTTNIDVDIAAGIRHDLFQAIEFESRPGDGGTMTGLQLDAHFVFKWIVQTAWNHFCASIPTASRCKFYTCEALFNDKTEWASYERGIHIAIGRCLMFFCEQEMLPVECGNPHATYKKVYTVFDKRP